MFNLKSVELCNFLSYEYANLDFTKAGLYLISGYSTIGGDSNGSGKSAILSAICFALFGRTTTGLSSRDVKRWDSKESMSVSLLLLSNTQETTYRIDRDESVVSFFINNEKIAGNQRDIQFSINTTFNTNYSLFIRSTLFSQSQAEFFGSAGDADKKRLFKSILGLDKVDGAYAKVKVAYDYLSSRLDGINLNIGHLKNNLKVYEEDKQKYMFLSSEEQSDKEKKIQELQELKERKKPKYPKEIDSIKLFEKELLAYNMDMLLREEELDRESITTFSSELFQIVATIENLRTDLNNVSNLKGLCPLCGSELTKKSIGGRKKDIIIHIQEFESKKDFISIQLEVSKRALKVCQNTIYDAKILEEKLQEYKLVEFQYQTELKSYNDFVTMIDKRIVEEREKAVSYEQIVKDLQDKIEAGSSLLQKYQKETAVSSKDMDVYAFLKWVLSREGVSSFIIEKSFSRLQYLANKYLVKISNEPFVIDISPQKELRSGELKEEIDIAINTGNHRIPYWGLSDGQRQRINTVLLFAIHKLCSEMGVNSFNFLLLDEVLDLSLDSGGQQDMSILMGELRSEIRTIVVVSHQDILKAEFDHLISIRRGRDGISEIVS